MRPIRGPDDEKIAIGAKTNPQRLVIGGNTNPQKIAIGPNNKIFGGFQHTVTNNT